MRRQIYTLILILGVMLLFPLSGTAATKGIRIVPRSAWVKNDSLHLSILMDLEDVQVNTYTAVTFTPVLTNKQSTLELPAVILTGGSRHRFDRREQALQTNKSRQAAPFLTIIQNRNTASHGSLCCLDATVVFIITSGFKRLLRYTNIRHRHTKIPVAFRIGASHRNSHRHKGAE